MDSHGLTPDAARAQRRIVAGLRGWVLRLFWRRKARRMSEEDVRELEKRVVILSRQLDGLPFSSRLARRRMELLRDRERCRVMIAEWEERIANGRSTSAP